MTNNDLSLNADLRTDQEEQENSERKMKLVRSADSEDYLVRRQGRFD